MRGPASLFVGTGGGSVQVFIATAEGNAKSAFEHGAVDYVLKPLKAARLFTTVGRVKERLHSPPRSLDGVLAQITATSAAPTGPRSHLRWINASVGQNLKLITVDEVQYFQADSKYTRVVLRDGDALIRKPLKELVEELDPQQFWQIHRSTLVNASAISGVTRDLRGRMLVRLTAMSDSLLVAESYAHRFRQM